MSAVLKKNFKWNLIFQYGYTLTNMVNSLFLLPFYVRFIGNTELGIWWATGNILTWLTMVDPGVGDIIQQRIAKKYGSNEDGELSLLITSGIVSSVFVTIFSILLGAIFYFKIGDLTGFNLDKSFDLKISFKISIFATAISLFTFCLSGVNQGFLRSKAVAVIFILGNVIFFIVNLVLLVNDYDILSIAIANFTRSIFLLIAFSTATVILLKKLKIQLKYNHQYFISFTKVFSHTSFSKIFTTFSISIDLLILARFTSPAVISIFEINRRPIKLLQGLIGRYSVALMPAVSYQADDKDKVEKIITGKFLLFVDILIALISILFLTYEELLTFWVGTGKYMGDLNLLMILVAMIFSVSGYYLSNMIFAVGDFRANSVLSIIKGLFTILISFLSTKYYGIHGLLVSLMFTSFTFDFLIFYIRIKAIEYLKVRSIDIVLRLIVALTAMVVTMKVQKLLESCVDSHLWVVNTCIFIIVYWSIILFINGYSIRKIAKGI